MAYIYDWLSDKNDKRVEESQFKCNKEYCIKYIKDFEDDKKVSTLLSNFRKTYIEMAKITEITDEEIKVSGREIVVKSVKRYTN